MIDSQSDCSAVEAPTVGRPWRQHAVLAAMCTLVIGIYAYTAHSGVLASGSLSAADNYYNLLVQGFRAGHLSLKKEVPPGLAQLPDPYDPTKNGLYQVAPYGMLDLSYYKGRLYLYFGATPALILFWPYLVLTGHYLSYGQAGLIFCTVGFLAGVYLLCALWRRYFVEVSIWVVAAVTLALGLATGALIMLARCKHNDVPISCGYALTMLALAAIWKALFEPERRCRWLAMASLAYGLAVGARPSLLFGAIILLVPVAQAWRGRRMLWAPLLAAIVPIALIGVGLMLYNEQRFDNPMEFGWHYQLSPGRQVSHRLFSLEYLWFNFRLYFLEPGRWSVQPPFVRDVTVPPAPRDYGTIEHPFGLLTNIPLVWLALAAPLACRGCSGRSGSVLRWFVVAVTLLFGICALTIDLFWSAIIRYEVEFLPTFALLAVIGILGLERALADRPAWRCAARWCWSLLLGFSVAFNILVSVEQYAEEQCDLGRALQGAGQIQEAIEHHEQALRLKPDYAEAHYRLGMALQEAGQVQEAIEHYEQALRLKPDYVEAENNLGVALARLGKPQEAIEYWLQAVRINPDYANAHYNLGVALEKMGHAPEAVQQYKQALLIKPDDVQIQNALARARPVP